jgi:hypothetical protein
MCQVQGPDPYSTAQRLPAQSNRLLVVFLVAPYRVGHLHPAVLERSPGATEEASAFVQRIPATHVAAGISLRELETIVSDFDARVRAT